MASKELEKPDGSYPTTWPGALVRALELATESPYKLVAVLLVLAVVVFAAVLAARTGWSIL